MNRRIKSSRANLIALVTAAALGASSAVPAQSPAGTVATDQPKALFITIIEGEGALNDVRTRTAREPIVEVDDENHKPVAGALVLFSIDNGGSSPYATFAGSQTLSVPTNAAGRAVGTGFRVTQKKGRYSVKVRASKGQLVAEGLIAESNISVMFSPEGGENPVIKVSHKKLEWMLGGVAAAGVIVGVIIATRQTTTTITPGTGTVGAPAATGGFRIQLHAHHP